ncbi:MarR family winged helix-turn-helix transcriptional regulator [Paenibacillus sp. NFR01]|uniref:MarR family winged helix-turn-helix transcriptional regulator n=1 Tax=Paenibacillus sp. NFR01 TaxID=1566279 RepID=UPI0008C92918|nr:MarR family transcriptional regulator [Paenibacillus sp. NFR01]SET11300.1 DNA-binding transcriptional regulator, MarR family [Paenibacillus sp. NFR01]
MENEKLNEAAQGLSSLLTVMDRRLIRPHEQKTRHIVSPLVIHVLMILSERESAIMTELAQEIQIAKSQLTPIIDKLCENGDVEREHDAKDRRIINIRITPKGAAKLRELQDTLFQSVKSKLEPLAPQEIASLQHALNELYRIINKM